MSLFTFDNLAPLQPKWSLKYVRLYPCSDGPARVSILHSCDYYTFVIIGPYLPAPLSLHWGTRQNLPRGNLNSCAHRAGLSGFALIVSGRQAVDVDWVGLRHPPSLLAPRHRKSRTQPCEQRRRRRLRPRPVRWECARAPARRPSVTWPLSRACEAGSGLRRREAAGARWRWSGGDRAR